MSDDVVSVLQRARERVAAGWCQGALCMPYVPWDFSLTGEQYQAIKTARAWCMSGALIAEVGQLLSMGQPAVRYLRLAIDADFPDWNDRPCRTQAEVLDAFEKAIRLAKDAPHA